MFRPVLPLDRSAARDITGVPGLASDAPRAAGIARGTLRLDARLLLSRLTARSSRAPSFAMRKGDMLRIQHRKAARAVVRSGAAWLTRPGDSEDHCLRSGQAFDLDGRSGTLVQALARTVLEVTWAEGCEPERMTLIRAGEPIRVLVPAGAFEALRCAASRLLDLVVRSGLRWS